MILVDTHVVVWPAFDQGQLSKKARAAIDDARKSGDGLAISDITLLELATLAGKGRIHLDISLESFL
ncbi:MAG TPA: PIN domain-containing protein, partial [Bryobacteraceae bacterium]|nr:PIN domain-containing protein [Bryobacteraceae bacterium]